MAHALIWPTTYGFFPIGNTSAVSLTNDLPPDEPAKVLLLGCGDPRHILFTIYTQKANSTRPLDFTCCDIDPAILARNVLLFTLLADGRPQSLIWNIFFHYKLDAESHALLIAQCKKLVELAKTPQKWRKGSYGKTLKMSTDYTLAEIRRHWALYVTFPDLPETRHRAIANSFARRGKVLPFQRFSQAWRSAGPLMCGIDFKEGVTECVRDWWKNGLLAVEGDKSLLAATILNPTFVYSMAGEGCALNYTISPLTCFHLAPIVAQEPLTQLHLIDGMKAQFAGWCSALRGALSSSSPPILRFFVGDATVVCHSIRIFANSRSMKPGMPVSQWKTEPVQFNQWEYVDSPNPAPTSFNVIHTSNLEDSIGLLNVLISTVPLLSQEPSSVLYTESLETKGQDGVKEFEFEDGRLHGNITIMALVLGVCPVDYLCGFGTRTNTHELLLDHGGSHLAKKNMEKNKDEYHDPYYVQQIIKWKAPTSGDPIASQIRVPIPSFEPKQMGEFLFDLHQSLFPVKAAVSRWDPNADTLVEALGNSKVETHYTREAFALIVSLVRSRFQPSMDDWRQTLSVLRNRVIMASTKSNILAVHLVDWAHQMERYGLIGTEKSDMNRKQGPFRAWKKVPDQVRVILVVPKPVIDRAKLKTICEDPKLGYPPFHCDITSTATERSMFWSCLHASFGRVIRTGTEDNPQVIFEEDVKGWNGDSPLVVSFTTPYNVFTEDWGPYETISVNFGILNTPRMSKFFPGTVDRKASSMRHFSAQATDSSFVHIVPEPPLPRRRQMQEDSTVVASEPSTILVQQIGTADAAHFQLDEDCEQVASLGVRIEVTDERSKRLFSVERGKVTVEQLSACVLRVTLGGRVQDIAFPFPVVGSQHHLRLARTSGYIEVVVPPFNSQRADGMKLNPYPIIRHGSAMIPWSFHRLSLPSLPIVDRSSRVLQHLCSWLNPHICTMFSTRERAARKHGQHDMIMFVKDTILSVFTDATGMQQNRTPRQAFRFLDESMKHGSDTYIFLNEIRFDLESHTVVCDCYVMTLTLPLLALIQKEFTKFVASGEVALIPLQTGETQAWKQIMPSLVERCRETWEHGPDCEYLSEGRIPVTTEMWMDPLCRCGRGKGVDKMRTVALWKPFAPYATRMVLSPMYAVPYFETVGKAFEPSKCTVCRVKGKAKLKKCAGCMNVRYCSPECQKKDWQTHKLKCKGST